MDAPSNRTHCISCAKNSGTQTSLTLATPSDAFPMSKTFPPFKKNASGQNPNINNHENHN